jgi:hypothetical protein
MGKKQYGETYISHITGQGGDVTILLTPVKYCRVSAIAYGLGARWNTLIHSLVQGNVSHSFMHNLLCESVQLQMPSPGHPMRQVRSGLCPYSFASYMPCPWAVCTRRTVQPTASGYTSCSLSSCTPTPLSRYISTTAKHTHAKSLKAHSNTFATPIHYLQHHTNQYVKTAHFYILKLTLRFTESIMQEFKFSITVKNFHHMWLTTWIRFLWSNIWNFYFLHWVM